MNKKNISGFTLIEVIVAMVISLIIVFPFMAAFIMSTKINTEADFMKRATDVVELAQKDIRTWDEDILEALANSNKQWAYLNTKNSNTLYSTFRKLLDDSSVVSMDMPGEQWGQGLDVYFKVEKDLDYENVSNANTATDLKYLNKLEDDNLRRGYDLYIRVTKDGIKFKDSSMGADEANNNNGKGYYLDVTVGNSSSTYKLRKIPEKYTPLEKLDTPRQILFGGLEWTPIFTPTAGNVAVMYTPKSIAAYIKKAFDLTGSSTFMQTGTETSWENIASYLNNEFYNSLVYNEYVNSENYYTNKNWIKKHTWLTGGTSNYVETSTSEYVGLLNCNEIDKLKNGFSANGMYKTDSYTITPNGDSQVYLANKSLVSPTSEHYVFPIIYLDKDLYCKEVTTGGNYMLYEPQDIKLRTATLANTTGVPAMFIGNKTVSNSTVKVLIQFDDDLTEKNFEDKYYEKLRLLVNVTDNRSTKNAKGLTIYTINNRDVGNYKWLNLQNANKKTEFKIVDSMYLEEEYDNTYDINDSLKRKFKVHGYKITTWAEYMAPDEYRGTVDNGKNKHETLVLYINKEKEIPTFQYKDNGTIDTINDGNEVDNSPKDNIRNKMHD